MSLERSELLDFTIAVSSVDLLLIGKKSYHSRTNFMAYIKLFAWTAWMGVTAAILLLVSATSFACKALFKMLVKFNNPKFNRKTS